MERNGARTREVREKPGKFKATEAIRQNWKKAGTEECQKPLPC